MEKEKLFNWKRSGGYAWKACFPLTRAERMTRAGAPAAEEPAQGSEPAGQLGPLAPQGGKP